MKVNKTTLSWFVIVVGVGLLAAMVTYHYYSISSPCPVEMRLVGVDKGKASFSVTNQSSLDVMLRWEPLYETRVGSKWESFTTNTIGVSPQTLVILAAKDETFFTGVPIPLMSNGTLWRMRIKVATREGTVGFWLKHPGEFWDEVQFKDNQGKFKIWLKETIFPHEVDALTPQVRVGGD